MKSWSRLPLLKDEIVLFPKNEKEISNIIQSNKSVLPRGLGSSYGDSCRNENGILIHNRELNKIHSLDTKSGLIKCDSGVSFAQILNTYAVEGWFPPVMPGTKYVTVGGAIANDIHGKNHFHAGSFCHYLKRLLLIRSNGVFLCSAEENQDLFYATIGGLGLTGFVVWAEFYLSKQNSTNFEQEILAINSLDDFFKISQDSLTWEHTITWLDTAPGSQQPFKGLFSRGRFAKSGLKEFKKFPLQQKKSFLPENKILNSFSIPLINQIFYQKNKFFKNKTISFDQFLFPLDSIPSWNRLFGRQGFYQYHLIVPNSSSGKEAIKKIIFLVMNTKEGSALTSMKIFGGKPSLGYLSFARAGISLAMDIPEAGRSTAELFSKMDEIVLDAGGALYPAKDARMSKEMFRASFPRWKDFITYVDPKCSSSLFRRVST